MVQPEKDVPVVIHIEQIIRVLAGAKPLSRGCAKQQFGLCRAATNCSRQPVVFLRRPLVEVHVFLVVLFLSVRQHPSLGEEHVGDEVIDDLLNLVFVLFVDTALAFHMVDDERSRVL